MHSVTLHLNSDLAVGHSHAGEYSCDAGQPSRPCAHEAKQPALYSVTEVHFQLMCLLRGDPIMSQGASVVQTGRAAELKKEREKINSGFSGLASACH